jgi:acyl transferase domain-containing protein/acyl-CoA synthetase (AMP-forming)/AMP-acid ligase II/acyl carrier protein
MTILDLLQERAQATPDRVAYTFLADGDTVHEERTWGQLARRAQAVAAQLEGQPGDRVLLAFEEGLEFLDAFFGCVWAGRLAVPVHAPDPRRLERTLGRLRSIVTDADVASILTTSDLVSAFDGLGRRVQTVDRLEEGATLPVVEQRLAYLQYTSGSTSEPKGVRVTHANLVHQLRDFDLGYDHTPDGAIVSWLPATHDLGMVYGRLMSLWTGLRCVFFPPAAFVQRPARWMRAMSTFRGTHSPSPNFGFDLAAQRPSEEELAGVELSHVKVLLNGAEPIRRETEARFLERYRHHGLRPAAVTHAYGMSETTAKIVTEPIGRDTPRFVDLDPVAYERNEAVVVLPGSPRARVVASNGSPHLDTRVFAVDPATGRKLGEGRVGEIWVGGSTVADGYWNRPELSAEIFGGRTDDGDGPFLRTGDLGFLLDGELYLSGRKKDVIILRGQNLHPPDLEREIEAAHAAIRGNGVAAFGFAGPEGEEVLGIAAEVNPDADPAAILAAVRAALGEMGLAAATIVLLQPRGIPKTSSGKLQRAEVRARLQAGTLPVVARSDAARRSAPVSPLRAAVIGAPRRQRLHLLEEALRSAAAARLGLEPREIDPESPFLEFGLDSIAAVSLVEDISRSLGVDLPRTSLFDHPSVVAMAQHLEAKLPPAPDAEAPPASEAPSAAPAPRAASAAREPIAVVGLACRFPGGANDPDRYWALLEAAVPVAGPVPAERWDEAQRFQSGPPSPGKTYARAVATIDDVAGFDAAFFGINDAEAQLLDPQQRLLLEVAWEALEDAGARADRLRDSRTGVFVGAAPSHWANRMGAETYLGSPYSLTGTDVSFLAGRLSYVLGLRGPSSSVSTACSSSLVALHAAVKSLQDRGCDVALAGGVSLMTTADTMLALSQVGALSPDGTCKTFDAAADGYGRGEGCGVVLLKRLSDAVADGDRIHGVIRGVAVNHDGRSSGLTVPSGAAQTELIRTALADAGLAAADVDFLECHGTGTVLGDPIEVRAAGEAYAEGRPGDRPLRLGSSKAVVGHLEAAAAMAGVFKVLLALQHGRIPPNRVTTVNPELPLREYPLQIVTEPSPWARGPRPRLGAVSSFGLSGTNAHVILEEAPATTEAAPGARGEPPWVWPVSGRSEAAVHAYAERLLASGADPADVGASLLRQRAVQDVRGVAVASDRDALRAAVAALEVRSARRGTVAFVFDGQGAQREGMGAGLYARFPVFRQAFDAAVAALAPHLEGDLRQVIWASTAAGDRRPIDRTEWTQPCLFAVQIATAALWRSLGVEPSVVIGHSIGEFAAACVSGVLSLPDAARLVAARGRAMGALPPGGAMAAVAAPEAEVVAALVPGAEIAAVNGPRSVVVSGDAAAVAAVTAGFSARGARVTPLTVSHAFHSSRMEPMLATLAGAAAAATLGRAGARWIPTGPSGEAPATPAYWVAQARSAVRFEAAVRAAGEAGCTRFLEIGGGSVLLGLVGQTLSDHDPVLAGTLSGDGDEVESVLRAAGALWSGGQELDWAALVPAGRQIALPKTVWQHERYWLDEPEASLRGTRTGHALLGNRLPAPGGAAVFGAVWSARAHPWLADHLVGGRVVVPGTALLETLRAAGAAARGEWVELVSVTFERPVVAAAKSRLRTQVVVAEDGSAQLWTQDEGDPPDQWTLHATATVRPAPSPAGRHDVDAARAGLGPVPLDALHERFAAAGLRYGPAFRGLAEAWDGDGRSVGRLVIPDGAASEGAAASPAVLDAALQLIGASPGTPPGLPFEVAGFRVREGAQPAWVVVERAPGGACDVRLVSASGAVVAELTGVRVRAMRGAADLSDALFREAWVDAPAAEPAPRPDDVVVPLDGDPVAALVRAVAAIRGAPGAARVFLVASGALAGAARGLVRSLEVERPDRVVVAVEVEPGVDPGPLLAREPGDERVVRWTGERRQVARLARRSGPVVPATACWALEKGASGEFSALRFAERERRPPGPGEVEIRVEATGLNFRDVMNVLGVYPGDAGRLGIECSGIVAAAGEGAGFAVGDAVMTTLQGGFAPYVTVPAAFASPVPAGVSLVQAASLPAAFLTAWYALVELAGLKAGDRVLIHAATGGVGTAAVQIAQWLGAEVYGTASPRKQGLLREAGVRHVASSRDLDFARAWKDEGITVVLNALSGPFVDAGLGLLQPGGRFVEMGKTDLRDPAEVRSSRGVSYASFDLFDAPASLVSSMYASLRRGFAEGRLRPGPVTVHPLAEVETAFRTMAGGGHVGKIVIHTGRGNVRPDGAVLVTGGLGALGRVASRWAVARGARSLVLLTRRGLDADGAAEEVAALGALGASVSVVAGDVSDPDGLRRAVQGLDRPLRGVIHAAGVLDDAALDQITEPQIARVAAPKIRGLEALEAATASADLDWFVVYSSVASVLGNRGQAVYAAVNAWMDARMEARVRRGLPGQSIQWGPWSEIGMAAGLELDGAVRGIDPAEGAALLDVCVRDGLPTVTAARLDLRQAARERVPSFLRGLVQPSAARTAGAAGRSGFAAQLLGLPAPERRGAVREAIREDVSRTLSCPIDKVTDKAGLSDLGMDSLLAIELRNALSKRVGERLPATFAFDFPTVEGLTDEIWRRLGVGEETAPAPAAPTARAGRRHEPIAVVGMACRFPGGANDPDAYFRVLEAAESTATEVPLDRWDHAAVFAEGGATPGKTYSRRVSLCDDVASFDAAFFGIPAREALLLDPQQRLVLELGWEALEDARVRIDALERSKTGVYVGVVHGDYVLRTGAQRYETPYTISGSDTAFVAGRLAFHLGLRGPAVSVSTACSSSLVALHQAVQALRDGECDLALAGGVNVLSTAGPNLELAQIGALAPDGRCKPFDAAANGYGRGEGCGVLVLQRLSDALASGAPIHAVIRGSAINHDGHSSGLTVPSGPAQREVIASALRDAALAPEDVDYLECHGPGTRLGDPIEVRAAGEAYAGARDADHPLWLGSAKQVVGHLEAAAAMAGVFKVLLALRHQRIPPNRVSSFNPELPLSEFPLQVVTEPRPWPRGERPRRAAVSSFGLSGTNAHLVLEEAPAAPPPAATRGEPPYLWLISGRSAAAVTAYGQRLLDGGLHPADVGATLWRTRAWQDVRGAVVGADEAELRAALASLEPRAVAPGGLAFVFNGGGAQRPGMGSEAYARFDAFRIAFDAALAAISPHVRGDLRSILWSASAPELDLIEWSLPALFVVQVAQAALWRSLGVVPAAVIGHSAGEFAAAHVAGVLSLEDAAALIAARARLMGTLPPGGAMVAVAAAEDTVRAALVPGAEIGVVNGPRSVVVSGEEGAVLAVAAAFAARGVKTNRLAVSMGSHSHRVEPILDGLRAVAERTNPGPGAIRVLPTGGSAAPFASTEYWLGQLRGTVRFGEAVAAAGRAGLTRFVEIGPTTVLMGLVGQTLEAEGVEPALAATVGPDGGEVAGVLRAAGTLWSVGHEVPVADLVPPGALVTLPHTVWQHQRFWVDSAEAQRAGTATGHALLGVRVPAAGSAAVFETTLSVRRHPWLGDHLVGGAPVVPGTTLLELLRAGGEIARGEAVDVESTTFERAMILPASGSLRVQVWIGEDGAAHVYSQPETAGEGEWTHHATGLVRPATPLGAAPDLEQSRKGLAPADLAAVRQRIAGAEITLGPAFEGLTEAWYGDGKAVGRIRPPAGLPLDGVAVAPALLDAAVQASFVAPDAAIGRPFEVARFRVRPGGGVPAGVVTETAGDSHRIVVLAGDGSVLAELSGLRTRAMSADGVDVSNALYTEEWVELPRPEERPGDADVRIHEASGPVVPAVQAAVAALQAADPAARVILVASGPLAGAMRGLVRSLEAERPDQRVVAVEGTAADAALERCATDDERVVRYVDGKRLAARLKRDPRLAPPASPSWRLERGASADLSALRFVTRERTPPRAGEVEIRVDHSGLNFRDVMTAIGAYPGEPGPLGLEVSGWVERVGDGVVGVSPGDAVMALCASGFAPWVTTPAARVVRVPAGVSLAEAAAVPVAYVTAWHALEVAGLRRGEKVLVHAAAGGVGTAAVHVARALGAEVFATASPGKWDALRAMGVRNLASSRDTAFAETWKDAGIDVVLDASSGAIVDAGLSVLRPGGRFVALGKADLRDPAAIAAQRQVRYTAVDLGTLSDDDLARTLAAVAQGLRDGALRPLPIAVAPLERTVDAFRTLAAAGHVGKLVLHTGAGNVHGDGWVVVSGGFGGLARVAIRWALSRGARSFVLLSRRGLSAEGAAAEVAALEALGARVRVAQVDVADERAVREALAGLPVRAVLHTAGVVDDALLPNVRPEQVQRVLAPKADGLLALAAATAGADLDWFLVFSSAAATLGSPGLAVYAAANGFEDAWVEAQRASGRRVQSIRWGHWATSGMGARTSFGTEGGVGFTDAEGAALLEVVTRAGAATPIAGRFDLRTVPTSPRVPSIYRALVRARTERAASAQGAFGQQIAALPPAERRSAVREAVRQDVARTLSIPLEKATDATPLSELGMDSLLAIELRNTLSKRLGERLPATVAFDHPSIGALAAELWRRIGGTDETAPPAVPSTPARPVDRREAVAIVGMACRFPGGANDPQRYWSVLEAGSPVAGPVPPDRWDQAAYYQEGDPAPGRTNVRAVSTVDGVGDFDAAFFGVGPNEALYLDPQHRMVLELGWEALEDAGVRAETLRESRTGVFVGVARSEWQWRMGPDGLLNTPYGATGTDPAFIPGRLSFTLGLRGPAAAVSTACSSSLVAIHDAVRSLQEGECDLAFAGGVSIMASVDGMIALSQVGVLAPDGVSKSFDAAADGFGRGEGCGMVLLKRLSDAEAAGDRILGVIRGVAVNHGGRSSGITVPSGPAQTAVIRAALRDADVSPSDVTFLECMGAGSQLGDSIEVRAAGEAYVEGRPADRPLWIGSAKSVVGHLEAAGAMPGVLKVLLALQHGQVPPTRVSTPNPDLPLGEFAMEVVTATRPWARGDGRRIAAVHSFGMSGTNAHLVIEEPPAARAPVPPADGPYLWPVSGRSEAAVRALAAGLLTVSAHPADVAHTLVRHRSASDVRAVLVGTTTSDFRSERSSLQVSTARPAGTVFVFGGAGPERPGAGAGLYARFPVFRQAFDAAVEALAPTLGGELRAALWGERPLGGTPWSGAGLFAVQVGQAALWRSLSVTPEAVVGEGAGVFAAAFAAGVLSLSDAARLAAVHALSGVGSPEWRDAVAATRPEAGTVRLLGGADGVPAWSPEHPFAAAVASARSARFLALGLDGAALDAVADAHPAAARVATLAAGEEVTAFLRAVGAAWASGEAVDLAAVVAPGNRAPLPRTAWQHQRFWLDAPGAPVATRAPAAPAAPARPARSAATHPIVAGRPREEWPAAVLERLKVHAATCGFSSLQDEVPMWDQGLDSMRLLELRNLLLKDGITLPVVNVIKGPPLTELAAMVVAVLDDQPVAEVAAASDASSPAPDAPALEPAPGEPEELAPLSPVVSHLGAAFAGAVSSLLIAYVIVQIVTALR